MLLVDWLISRYIFVRTGFRGTVRGTVNHPQCGLIANAKIVATERATKTEFRTVSDTCGKYTTGFLGWRGSSSRGLRYDRCSGSATLVVSEAQAPVFELSRRSHFSSRRQPIASGAFYI
jgi:hypothetical protein